MAEASGAVLAQLLSPLLLALASAAGAWLATRIPGPLRDWLGSAVHQRDVALVVEAMARRALALKGGGVAAPASPPLDVIAYVRASLPEVLAKLAPSDEALRTMAVAALQRAAAATATAGGIPPPR